jgi:hypothetical protein
MTRKADIEEHRLRVLENGSEKYFDLRGRKWQEVREDCIIGAS